MIITIDTKAKLFLSWGILFSLGFALGVLIASNKQQPKTLKINKTQITQLCNYQEQ